MYNKENTVATQLQSKNVENEEMWWFFFIGEWVPQLLWHNCYERLVQLGFDFGVDTIQGCRAQWGQIIFEFAFESQFKTAFFKNNENWKNAYIYSKRWKILCDFRPLPLPVGSFLLLPVGKFDLAPIKNANILIGWSLNYFFNEWSKWHLI